MKIIASTTALHKVIKESISSTRTFVIHDKGRRLSFLGDKNFFLCIESSSGYRNMKDYYGIFIPDTWGKIMKFLSKLSEQPIVLEFSDPHIDDHVQEPEIELSQFVIKF